MNEDISAVCIDAGQGFGKHNDCNGKFYKKETFRKVLFHCQCQCHHHHTRKFKATREVR